MGVSGTGKSLIGSMLATRLGLPFADADDFHTPENIAKMARGEPLDDADRAPWLATLAGWLAEHGRTGAVLSCSALKRAYRDVLRRGAPAARFLHLTGDAALLGERIAQRSGHFMPASLLASQLATLEPLAADERGLVLDVHATPEALVEACVAALSQAPKERDTLAR